jgi:hypothetical protein
VKVNLKSVGYRVVVNARRQPAGANQRFAVEAARCGQRTQFLLRVPRKLSATTANVSVLYLKLRAGCERRCENAPFRTS